MSVMHQNNSPPDHLFCRCYDDVIHLCHQNRRQHYHHPRRRDDDKSKYSRLYNLSFITLSVTAVKIRLSDFFPDNPQSNLPAELTIRCNVYIACSSNTGVTRCYLLMKPLQVAVSTRDAIFLYHFHI